MQPKEGPQLTTASLAQAVGSSRALQRLKTFHPLLLALSERLTAPVPSVSWRRKRQKGRVYIPCFPDSSPVIPASLPQSGDCLFP